MISQSDPPIELTIRTEQNGLTLAGISTNQEAIPTESQATALSWHPKLTCSRLLFLITTLGLGIAKAAASYRGDSIAPVTIEWIAGVVVFLIFLLFTSLEGEEDAWPGWFFRTDLLKILWESLRERGRWAPNYVTEERDMNLLVKPKHPTVTLYRLLVTACVLVFGLLKATLAYQGYEAAPVTVEWVFGVAVTIVLWYIGLYEASSHNVLPAFFETDRTEQAVVGSVSSAIILLHLVALAVAGWWSHTWGASIIDMWSPDGTDTPGTPPSYPPISGVDVIFERLMKLTWTFFAALMGVAPGAVVCVAVLVSLSVKFIGPTILWIYKHLALLVTSGQADESGEGHTEWSPGPNFDRFLTNLDSIWNKPPPALQLIAAAAMWIGISAGYILAHALAFCAAAGWTMMWVYGLYSLWSPGENESGGWFFFVAFKMFWSLGACGATLIGTYGTLYVVVCFFSILTGRHMMFG